MGQWEEEVEVELQKAEEEEEWKAGEEWKVREVEEIKRRGQLFGRYYGPMWLWLDVMKSL